MGDVALWIQDIVDIDPDEHVKAMNEINAAARMRVAANEINAAARMRVAANEKAEAEKNSAVYGLRDSAAGILGEYT